MKTQTVAKVLLAATALASGFSAFGTEWKVIPETSSVGFIGAQQGTRFNGRFETFTAGISFDATKPATGHIVGTVELATVNTRDHDRDAALLEKDWFDTKQFPQARFESQKIETAGDGFRAVGELTLKGQTKPATLEFTFTPGATSSGPPASAQFAGKLRINRFDFNVGEGWNDTSWVAQDVEVEVKLDLKQ